MSVDGDGFHMNGDHRFISETICRIEQECDINSVRYKDLRVWPMVRLALSQQLFHPDMNFTRQGPQPHSPFPELFLDSRHLEQLKPYKDIISSKSST